MCVLCPRGEVSLASRNKAYPLIILNLRNKEVVLRNAKGINIIPEEYSQFSFFNPMLTRTVISYCHNPFLLLLQILVYIQVCLNTHQAQSALLTTVPATRSTARIAKDPMIAGGASNIRGFARNMT